MTPRVFDRLPEVDPRSQEFPIRALFTSVGIKSPRSYTWSCANHLDQGHEGACVGFAWAHELMARPAPWSGVDYTKALSIYKEAQKVDQWPGEDYSGTSVLAGAKIVLNRLKAMIEYRWAADINDLILAVGYAGPAVLGINWYNGMFDTDLEGFIHPTKGIAGGHAILCKGVSVRGRYFTLHNSWGSTWGVEGDAHVSFDDMEKLLHEGGEACIPIHRIRQIL